MLLSIYPNGYRGVVIALLQEAARVHAPRCVFERNMTISTVGAGIDRQIDAEYVPDLASGSAKRRSFVFYGGLIPLRSSPTHKECARNAIWRSCPPLLGIHRAFRCKTQRPFPPRLAGDHTGRPYSSSHAPLTRFAALRQKLVRSAAPPLPTNPLSRLCGDPGKMLSAYRCAEPAPAHGKPTLRVGTALRCRATIGIRQ